MTVTHLTRSLALAACVGTAILTAAPAFGDPAPSDPTIIIPAPVTPPVDPLAPVALLMPQNFGMPTGEEPSPYALGENTPSPFARVDAFQGAHALLHSVFGRLPGDQLGQALPGTAPPPGTALPPGLAQFQPEPAEVALEVPAPVMTEGP